MTTRQPARPWRRLTVALLATAAVWLCGFAGVEASAAAGSSTLLAQVVPAPPKLNLEGGRREQEPPETRDMDLVEKLGERISLDVPLVNEAGETVRLGDFFNADKPVILNLGYFGCPMLCGQMVRALGRSLRELENQDGWVPGVNYEVVTVSFDPREGPDMAASAKERALTLLHDERAGEGWHFLTGSEADVRQIADAVGFPYKWSERSQQYVHPAAIMLLTPDGTVSRYLYGVSYPSTTLRLSLVESGEGKVGSTMDRILLYCFSYDDKHGEYTLVALNLMRLAGAMTLVVLAIAIGLMMLRGAHRQAQHQQQMDNPNGNEDHG